MNASSPHRARRAVAAMLLGAIPILSAAAQGARPGPPIPAPEQGAWPKTELRHGQYFSYPAPLGWQANESTNGVDLGNRDGSEGVSFVGLEGTPGSISPRQQIEKIGQLAEGRETWSLPGRSRGRRRTASTPPS